MSKVNMGCGRKRIPSLFDSGNQVTLICKSSFGRVICATFVQSSGEKAEAHQLFQLTTANYGRLPTSMYVKLDLDFLEIMVPKVGVLITWEPNKLLDECHKSKLPSIISWNLVKLPYEVFKQKYGIQGFDSFDCLTGVSLLLFSSFVYFTMIKQVESSWTV